MSSCHCPINCCADPDVPEKKGAPKFAKQIGAFTDDEEPIDDSVLAVQDKWYRPQAEKQLPEPDERLRQEIGSFTVTFESAEGYSVLLDPEGSRKEPDPGPSGPRPVDADRLASLISRLQRAAQEAARRNTRIRIPTLTAGGCFLIVAIALFIMLQIHPEPSASVVFAYVAGFALCTALANALLLLAVLPADRKLQRCLRLIFGCVALPSGIFITHQGTSTGLEARSLGCDLRDFNGFINGRAGISEAELDDLVDRGRKNKMPRTLFECGLTDAILYWTGVPCSVLLAKLVGRFVFCAALAVALPSEIMDYLWVYSVLLCFQWLLVFGFFYFNLNNILLMSSWLVWLAVFLVGRLYVIGVVGEQATTPSLWVRLPEFFISFLVFVEYLGFLHHLVLTVFRLAVAAVSEDGCFCLHMKRRIPREASNRRLHRCIRLAHVFFFSHQLHTLQAYIVLVANLMTSLFLASTDKVFCNLRIHTWWLLNSVAGDPKYLESETTWLEDANRLGLSDTSSTVTAGDTSEEANDSGSSEVGSHRRLLTAPATVPSGPERPSPATITSLGGTWPDPPFGSTWRDLGAERPSLA